ncbi:enoyl-[acyl-carrier-protein] reductase [NADH] [Marinobacterium zhoushanense]|uniref:Enoyl-[acyl-carrier-protein] reductase [NADH] n=1 Tax=Marinobacterium zhoushanense TaxID=1679163 RepID=A0ABQ1KP83_9GAMM|nr:enoyl-ACP reductase FabI [Marinobacterium zhoushanense]GGC04033.1 enoyl-[acyl-carrier-protein] reductase [NADH] [Marinobacterium zhoushanense]
MSLSMSLEGKRGVILGIANRHSIAYGCAEVMAELGAQLCITYLNEKSKPYVQPLADELGAELLLPCDVSVDGELEAVFHEMEKRWGTIDFAVHSIAWSPLEELHGRLVDSSAEGFCKAMDISCHSFVRMARQSQRLMPDGGTLLTMSYEGAEKVVEHYNLMGPIKAALDSCARYLAAELGEQQVRVHSISPGPMPTRAASGIDHFDELMEDATSRSPLRRLSTPEEVGALAAFLVSDMGRGQTGNRIFVDAGRHLIG